MQKKEQKPAAQMVTQILLGVLTALLIMLLMLFLCAVILSSGALNMNTARQLAITSCAIGAFSGAFLTVRRCGKRALPVGVGVGVFFFAALFLLAPLCTSEVRLGINQLPLLLICICAGILAGVAGKKRKKHRRA